MTLSVNTLISKLREKASGNHVAAEIAALNAYSMAGIQTLTSIYSLTQETIARGVVGDYVECGVCNGGTAAAAALALRKTDRRLWLYDSFEGMPAPVDIDGSDAAKWTGKCVGSEETVRKALTQAGAKEDSVVIRKGWFQDTFPLARPQHVAVLHIDADWYDSVILALRTWYDSVPDGGAVILDDFGYWEGCREAFYDFASERRIKPLVERSGITQAYWIKGRLHNRHMGPSSIST